MVGGEGDARQRDGPSSRQPPAEPIEGEPPPVVLLQEGVSDRVEDAQEEKAAVRIPSKAVFSPKSGEAKVWVIDPASMTVSSRDVTLGSLMGEEVVIESGLTAGEMIAIAGVHYLREGMQVHSMSPETQEAAQ